MSTPQKTTLEVAAQVRSPTNAAEQSTRLATVPNQWSWASGLVKVAQRLTGSLTSINTSGAATAEVVADLELPDEELALHFKPIPVRKTRLWLLVSFLITSVLVASIVYAALEYEDLYLGIVVLLYLAYNAECALFGAHVGFFLKGSRHSLEDGSEMLKRQLKGRGYVQFGRNNTGEVIDFERQIDISSPIDTTFTAETLFETFQSTKPILRLVFEYQFHLYSKREREFVQHRIDNFLTNNMAEFSRKKVYQELLLADGEANTLPRVDELFIEDTRSAGNWFVRFWMNYYVFVVMRVVGLEFLHRTVLNCCLVDTRVITLSKVFIAEFNAAVVFHITDVQGLSQLDIEMTETATNNH